MLNAFARLCRKLLKDLGLLYLIILKELETGKEEKTKFIIIFSKEKMGLFCVYIPIKKVLFFLLLLNLDNSWRRA